MIMGREINPSPESGSRRLGCDLNVLNNNVCVKIFDCTANTDEECVFDCVLLWLEFTVNSDVTLNTNHKVLWEGKMHLTM